LYLGGGRLLLDRSPEAVSSAPSSAGRSPQRPRPKSRAAGRSPPTVSLRFRAEDCCRDRDPASWEGGMMPEPQELVLQAARSTRQPLADSANLSRTLSPPRRDRAERRRSSTSSRSVSAGAPDPRGRVRVPRKADLFGPGRDHQAKPGAPSSMRMRTLYSLRHYDRRASRALPCPEACFATKRHYARHRLNDAVPAHPGVAGRTSLLETKLCRHCPGGNQQPCGRCPRLDFLQPRRDQGARSLPKSTPPI